MAYVEVRKDGKLVKRRLVDDARAEKGCRIRVGSAGQVNLRTGESKAVGKYEIAMLEGSPPDDGHEVVRQLGTKSDSFPAMSETEEAGFTGPAQAGPLGRKSPVPVIDDYEVTGRLGQGGMGTVWRAVQLSTKREVALKFLGRHRFASKRSRARFEREVSLAAKLTHPNIACVYDSGLHRGVYYYAMELVDGVHLDKYVQQNHLSQREILALMKDVCDAVVYAHEKGIIHRDLKPSNILVTEDGRPHVVDFGLAKASMDEDDDVTISVDGEITGTLAYMSPEQAAGRLDKIGEPTDVYSLGVILHQMLTGRLPHDVSGSRYDVVKRIVEEDVQSPRAYDDSVDSDLESLILMALAQEPQDRYPSAVILLQDIENYLNREPLLARSMSTTYRIRKRVRKHARPIAKALLLITILTAIIATSFYLVNSERKKRYEAEKLAGLSPERFAPEKLLEVQDNHDDVSGEQNAEQSILAWIPKRAPAPSAIQVNGKPFFVICARSCEPNDFAEVARAGFNTVSYVYRDQAHQYLTEAKKHGLRAIVYAGVPIRETCDWHKCESDVHALRNDSTLLAWGLPVCPIWHNRNLEEMQLAYETVKRADEKHPAFLLFTPRKRIWSLVSPYAKHCDVVAIEPSAYLSRDLLAVSHWSDEAMQLAGSKPVWVFIQAYEFNGTKPTAAQLRSMVYLAINHGAGGVFIDGYKRRLWKEDLPEDVEGGIGLGDPRLADLRREAARVAGEIRWLSPAILAGAVKDEVTIENDSGKIDFKAYAASDNQMLYLVAINTSDTEVQPTFQVPTVMESRIELLGETRFIAHGDGRFSDSFAPYDTHVYVLRTARSSESVEQEAEEPGRRAMPEPGPFAVAGKKILFYSQSLGYQHTVVTRPSERELSNAEQQFEKLATEAGYEVSLSQSHRDLQRDDQFNNYDAIVLYTTGSPAVNKSAFLKWLRSGGALIGVHAACDSFDKWQEYGQIMGGYFAGHGNSDMPVTIRIEDPNHPSTNMLGDEWTITDEIYKIKQFSRDAVDVLLSIDTGKMPSGNLQHHKMTRGEDYPVAWTNTYGNGRVFYTGLGHRPDVWTNATFQKHLLGGIAWALDQSHAEELSSATNVSEITDPKGNLMGNTQKAYLDIVKASVYEEGENRVFSVTTAEDFPAPKQLGNDDGFTFVWFVDIDRNRATGQNRSGNDYNIHLWCSNKSAWHPSWFKTSDASKQDGIKVDLKKIIIHVKDNTATLIFPKYYLPSDQFDWWVNTGTNPNEGPSAARNPPTQRGTFKRSLSGR